jgi:Secretion system C-terminal sorting domain/Chlamydia polymorphic membrane protein (Chlamydia_PMP) repeat
MKPKRMFFLFVVTLFMTTFCYAQTYVSGEIGSEVWIPDNGPYILTDYVYVVDGETLTIMPGTEIIGNPESRLYIEGELHAVGTPQKRILFSAADQNDRWYGIRLSGSENAVFKYCIIEYATTAPENMHNGGLRGDYSTVEIENCTFRYNHSDVDGGAIYLYFTDYSISYSEFYENTAGRCGGAIDLTGGTEGTIEDFHHLLIYNNYARWGGAVYFYDGDHYPDHITMYNNTSGGNCQEVYFWTDGWAQFSNSIIWNDVQADFPVFHTMGQTNLLRYTCIYDSTELGENVIYGNPLFNDPENGDFSLLEGSPCIDAGDPNYALDPDNSVTDLGAIPSGFNNNGAADSLIFDIMEVVSAPSSDVIIPIEILNDGELSIVSIVGEIAFPAIVMNVNSVSLVEGGPAEILDWSLNWSLVGSTIYFIMSGEEPLLGGGFLFQINATIFNHAEEGTYHLNWGEVVVNENFTDMTKEEGSITITEYPLGDVNLNMSVSWNDASSIFNYLSNEIVLSSLQKTLGRVSNDNSLNEYDAALIMQYSDSVIEEFPIITHDDICSFSTPVYSDSYISENDYTTVDFILQTSENISSYSLELEFDINQTILSSVSTTNNDNIIYQITPLNGGAKILFASKEKLSGENLIISSLNFTLLPTIESDVHVGIIGMRINNDDVDITEIEPITLEYVTTITGNGDLPESCFVSDIYPNPFNSTANITFTLNKAENVKIEVYNSLGKRVLDICDGEYTAGQHRIHFDAINLPSAIYFIKTEMGKIDNIQKVVLIR